MSIHSVVLLVATAMVTLGEAALRPLGAQTPVTLQPGMRVRIRAPSSSESLLGERTWVGSVLSVRSDTLLLQVTKGGDSVVVLVPKIARLEISSGRSAHTLKGAGIGLLAGASAGAFLGLLSGDDRSGLLSFTAGEKAVVFGLVFGVLGVPFGALIGSIRTDHWEEIPLGRLQVTITPAHSGGLRLGVAVSF